MYKKILLLILLTVNIFYFTFADDQEEIRRTKYELNRIQAQIDKFNSEKNKNLHLQSKLAQDIRHLEMEIEKISAQMDQTQIKIDETQKSLDNTNIELENAILDVENQDKNLQKRLRVMYKMGNDGFIDVVFNSKNIGDLITRIDRIQLILNADKKMLKRLNEAKVKVEDKKLQIETKKQELENYKNKQLTQKASLEANYVVLRDKKMQLAKDANEIAKQLEDFAKDADRLTDILRTYSSKQNYVQGKFAWPLDHRYNRITSPFLPFRINPVTHRPERHTGTDIAAPTGAPIYATKEGTVILSRWNGSYGNCVIIDHGGGFTTVYGHASKLLCNPGDKVSQGTVIALVGQTGVATGPHVHFEVRVNGQPQQPMNYTNRP